MAPSPTGQLHSLVRRHRAITRATAAVAVAVGGAVLVGWASDAATLTSVFPGLVSMKPNTAAGLGLAGVAAWLLGTAPVGAAARRTGRRLGEGVALLVALLGLLTLSEYLVGWNLGIDQRLFRDAPAAIGTASPGRMSIPTALAFVLIGCGLLLLDRTPRLSQGLILAVGLVACCGIVVYAYGTPYLGHAPRFTQMAVHTALTFLVLSGGILCARPRRGVMAVVTAADVGGVIARRLLPTAFLVPFAVSGVQLAAKEAGLVASAGFGAAFATANILAFAALALGLARTLSRADAERRAAERALRAGEERLRVTLDAAQVGTWEWDLATGTVRWSGVHKRLFGLAADAPDLRYDEVLARLHPADRAVLDRAVADAIRTRTEYRLEHRVVWPDGSLRWLGGQGRAVYDATGRAVRMLGVGLDVTERKQAEERLRGSEARLAQAQHLAHVGSWEWDIPANTVSWSDELYRIFGLDRRGFGATYEGFLARVHPDDRPRGRHRPAGIRDPRAVRLRAPHHPPGWVGAGA